MNTRIDNTAEHKTLSTIAIALIGGIIVFSSISILIHFLQDAFSKDKNFLNSVFTVLLLIAAGSMLRARPVYAGKVNNPAEGNRSSGEKFAVFRALTITQMALCKLLSILSILLFIFFGDFPLFLPVCMAVVEMIKKLPTQQRIESTVNSGTF